MHEHDYLMCVVGTYFNYGLVMVFKNIPAPSNQTYELTALLELLFQNWEGEEPSREWG